MKKMKSLIVILPFFCIIMFFLTQSFLVQDQKYSKEEARALKTIDEIDFSSFKKMTSDIEDYMVEQFPKRSEFLRAYSLKNKYLGKQYSRDVYISDDDWLFIEGNSDEMKNMPNSLAKILNRYPDKKFHYAILPTKDVALKDEYSFTQKTTSISNYKKLKSNLSKLNSDNFYITDLVADASMEGFLNDKDKWYRTDFHWNALGAKTAVDFILKDLKAKNTIENLAKKDDIIVKPLNEKLYLGDLNRRFSYIYAGDEMPLVLEGAHKTDYKYYMSLDDSIPVKRNDIISEGINKSKVGYEDIYTQNFAYYKVINENAPNNKSILILKDSMQNPTTDIFSETFYETIVVDPRLKQNYSFQEVIKNVDIVLFMYHQSNDTEDGKKYLLKKD